MRLRGTLSTAVVQAVRGTTFRTATSKAILVREKYRIDLDGLRVEATIAELVPAGKHRLLTKTWALNLLQIWVEFVTS